MIERIIRAYKIFPTRAFPEIPECVIHATVVRLVHIRESEQYSERREEAVRNFNRLTERILIPRYRENMDFIGFVYDSFQYCARYREMKMWRDL